MTGILGAVIGETPAQTKARVEEASKKANDLSGLVRKKAKDAPAPAPAPEAAPAEATETNGSAKRKAEEDAPAEEESTAKKAKVDE